MRKLTAVALAAAAALVAGPSQAADLFYPPPPIEVPQVDYGLSGSFYLRGSVAGNVWSAKDYQYCGCFTGDFDQVGYGYSVGAGFGYETGDGLRTDITIDYLQNKGMGVKDHAEVELRSALVLANVYYDFGLGGYNGSAAGGFGAYIGAGIGGAKNHSEITVDGDEAAWGESVEAAAAVMAGVTYDMGSVVADLGYRGIYMNKVMSQPENAADAYLINDNFISEVRGTLRYRFN